MRRRPSPGHLARLAGGGSSTAVMRRERPTTEREITERLANSRTVELIFKNPAAWFLAVASAAAIAQAAVYGRGKR